MLAIIIFTSIILDAEFFWGKVLFAIHLCNSRTRHKFFCTKQEINKYFWAKNTYELFSECQGIIYV